MATFSEVAVFVTLLMSSIHALFHPNHELRFGLVGEEATFQILPDFAMTTAGYQAFLYRLTQSGAVLLQNSSDPAQISDSEQSNRVRCFFSARDSPYYFVLRNLSLSDTGEYMTETWKSATHREWALHNLTVCAERMEVRKEEFSGAVEWTMIDVSRSQGDSLQVYGENLFKPSCPPKKGMNAVILDTRRSFKSLVSDLKGEVDLLSNGSSIRIWNISSDGACYHILAWKGEQCQLYTERKCTFLFERTSSYFHLVKPGDRLTLDCSPHVSGPVRWLTVNHSLPNPVQSLPVNHSLPNHVDTDMRNSSLVLPAASAAHAGRYCCVPEARPTERTPHWVVVCSELSPKYLMSFWGDSVELSCDVQSDSFFVIQWFGQRGLEPEALIGEVDSFSTGRVHEDLGGRVNFSQSSLTISRLSPEDSGAYWCRGWEGLHSGNVSCFERRITLLKIDFYNVYASVMGFGLMLMTCAVVSVKLRLRGGGPPPRRGGAPPPRRG